MDNGGIRSNFFVIAVANPKYSSIKQARLHSSPDNHVRLDQISYAKNCGKCSKLANEDAKAICCEFLLYLASH